MWIRDTFSKCLYNFIPQHPCSEIRTPGAWKGILYTFWRSAALWIRHTFDYKFSFPNTSEEHNFIIHITETWKHLVWKRPTEISSQDICFKHRSGYSGHYAAESQKSPTVEILLFLGNLLYCLPACMIGKYSSLHPAGTSLPALCIYYLLLFAHLREVAPCIFSAIPF